MKCIHIVVSGKVQGVFFRAHTRDKAQELGLKGYVKNLPDGGVEVVAQGQEDKLNELIEFCKKGPESAEVTDVKIEEISSEEEFDDFEVRY